MPITAEVRAGEPRRSPSGAAAVEVAAAHVTYRPRGRDPVRALSGMNLRVSSGEVVGVVGPSGCGKSTLLELVCGLRAPDEGEATAEPAALMPQRDLLLPWLSAIDNAALAPSLHGLGKKSARDRARPLFERFGLSGFESARPAELSGGMRQRVAFLRTLLAGTPLLALDEPFAGLDALTRREMQDWLTEALALEPRTVLLVTHDIEEALILCDRVIVMGPRPGRAVDELAVTATRPRRRGDPALVSLRERAADALGVGS
jgi:NitT/TauT family transport system ATP-binding protein